MFCLNNSLLIWYCVFRTLFAVVIFSILNKINVLRVNLTSVDRDTLAQREVHRLGFSCGVISLPVSPLTKQCGTVLRFDCSSIDDEKHLVWRPVSINQYLITNQATRPSSCNLSVSNADTKFCSLSTDMSSTLKQLKRSLTV